MGLDRDDVGDVTTHAVACRSLPWAASALVLLMCALIAAGCGGTADAKEGGIVLHVTAGRDPTGVGPKITKACSDAAKGRYTIEELILPPTVDGQREQLIRRLAGGDDGIDILNLDVIFTAEFVEAKWVVDVTDRIEPIKDEFVPATLANVAYQGKYWAIPAEANVALLYYRTDLVKTPPDTWEELVKVSKEVAAKHPDVGGFLWQANQYEGLTVDAMEFILQAGGAVLNEDGTKSTIADNPGAEKAFTFMHDLVADGISPKAVTTFQEEESRQAFQQGATAFMRNWPYAYPLGQGEGSKIVGKFAVAPLPTFEGQQRATVLGGHNLAISAFSKHKELAWEAMQCLTSRDAQRKMLIGKGNLPSYKSVYDDPALTKQLPYLPAVMESLKYGHPRPVTPYYNDVTYAINRNANAVTAGRISPKEAVERIDRAVQLGLDGKGEI